MPEDDPINHPTHYTFSHIEVADVLDAWELSYRLSNVIKYVARAGKKTGSSASDDLKKARWYLEREITLAGKNAK